MRKRRAYEACIGRTFANEGCISRTYGRLQVLLYERDAPMKPIGAPKCMQNRGTCEVHRAAVMPTGERGENLSYICIRETEMGIVFT